MSKHFKRVLALLLVLLMALGMLQSVAFAEDASNISQLEDTRGLGKRVPERYEQTRSLQPKTGIANPTEPKTALPATYNSNTLGYITPIRNQGFYGTCWAHGALASCEAYMIKHGVRVGNGSAATTSLNLSESHLSWFGYSDAYDRLGLLAGDKTVPANDYRDLGGFGEIPTYTLMRWEGLASESTSGLEYNRIPAPNTGLSSSLAYQVNVAHVQDCVWIPTSNRNAVKEAIMEYGAGTFGYYADDGTHETSAGAYYYPSSEYSNHDVTVVGWDDNYSRNNFAAAARPSSDGAWIIKNSWGTGYGTGGYYFISYEDVPSNNDTCYFYKVEPVDNYDNNYQYDGTSNFANYYSLNRNASVANVFTANGAESLEAVAFCNWDAGMSYTCNIYKNPTRDNPSSGTLVSTISGTFEYAGYHTVPLTTPVSLSAGDTFAVVFTNSGSSFTRIPLDKTGMQSGWVSWTHASPSDVSYYKSATGSWSDMSSTQNYRIKAYTVDNNFTVTATSNNTAWGTVSVSGRTITATPANGYYVASANVTSGTATIEMNGNTITVDTSSNCTVQVVFAAKTPATITFNCDYDTVNPISTFTGDTFTFPSAICDVPGYTFVGWCATTLSGASEATYFAPAATAVASGNATYYALFSYADGNGTGTGEWTLLENASNLSSGMRVVIASNENGFTAGEISSSVMTNIATTFSSDKSTITGLGTGTVELTVGGTSGAWTFAKEGGQLLGATAVKKLAWDSGTTTWSVSISNGAATIQSTDSSCGRFLYNVNSPRFAPYTSAANASMLLPQLYYMDDNSGGTLYTTNPSTCEHDWVEDDRLDASCTEAGTVLFSCSLCGTEKYEDIPALGHNYGAFISNNNGTHSKTCSRCSDAVTEDCSYTTSVSGATTTYTCSVCAYSYSSTANTYTVTYNDCGSTTTASCVEGQSVTLPAGSTVDGYTFAGWVTAAINPESTTAPAILTGSYEPTANVTLFALYTRTEGTGGAGLVKMKAGDTLADGDEIVVVANGTTVALYQETVNASYVNKYTFDNNINTVLADDKNYLTVNAVSGGFTLGDETNGYLSSSSNNLYVRSNVQTWTLLDLEDGTFRLQSGGRNLSYRSELSNKYWRMGGTSYGTSGQTVLDLYKVSGAGSTTYYTTNPIVETPCTHENTTLTGFVAATCTTAGYTGNAVCDDCGATVTTGAVIPATGHDLHYTDNGEDHTITCTRCDYAVIEAHSFTDSTCVCGAEEAQTQLKIVSAAPILNGKIDMAFHTQVPEGYTNAYMVINGTTVEADENSLCFIYTGITPQCMGDTINATLYATKNGTVECVSVNNYSVRQYCVNQLAKEEVTGALRTLLSDMLAYGAMAQVYMDYQTNALVTAGSDISNPTYSSFAEPTGFVPVFSGTAAEDTRWVSAGLTLTNSVAMNFRFYAASIENLSVKVSINGREETFTSNDFTAVPNKESIYTISFTGISAEEFADDVTASFYQGTTQVGNSVSNSVNAYVQSKQNSENAVLQALVRALYNYGAAAAAYNDSLN